jgi:uncharacterized protein YggU (UPF0235/DUF167 family)
MNQKTSSRISKRITRERSIKVVAHTDARRESLTELRAGSFSAVVRESAKGGRANTRIRELVARHFKVSLAAVRIMSGHHYPKKLLTVRI